MSHRFSSVYDIINRLIKWRWAMALIFVLTAGAYLLSRSRWLDDYDSVQFALGIEHFNLFLHQPHPPGYPLYVIAARILCRLLLFDETFALVFLSCLAGGLFVACWFQTIRIQIHPAFAWLFALSLAFMPMNWMTATKALSDMPASALMALAFLLMALSGQSQNREKDWIVNLGKHPIHLRRNNILLILAAGMLAAGCGFRPQNLTFSFLILVFALKLYRPGWKCAAWVLAVFILANLLWIIPTTYSQAVLAEAEGNAWVYRDQLLKQWKWRFNKPNVYLGAEKITFSQFSHQLYAHFIAGWYKRGMGWYRENPLRPLGVAVYVLGVCFFVLRKPARDLFPRGFWLFHLPWAIAYVLMALFCLPSAFRYYVPIAPFLLLPTLAGWWGLPHPWRRGSWCIPLLLLVAVLPLAWRNHTEPAPPVRLLQYIKEHHSPDEYDRVWLMITPGLTRHAQWYVPEFPRAPIHRPGASAQVFFEKAVAIYTDQPHFISDSGWKNVRLVKVGEFRRPMALYDKHEICLLYQVVPASPE